MTQNEAAERLRKNHLADDLRGFMEDDNWEQGITLLEDALALERAAERRATVERIREAVDAMQWVEFVAGDGSLALAVDEVNRKAIDAILDEEAAR